MYFTHHFEIPENATTFPLTFIALVIVFQIDLFYVTAAIQTVITKICM